jgi:hypothetical protein
VEEIEVFIWWMNDWMWWARRKLEYWRVGKAKKTKYW